MMLFFSELLTLTFMYMKPPKFHICVRMANSPAENWPWEHWHEAAMDIFDQTIHKLRWLQYLRSTVTVSTIATFQKGVVYLFLHITFLFFFMFSLGETSPRFRKRQQSTPMESQAITSSSTAIEPFPTMPTSQPIIQLSHWQGSKTVSDRGVNDQVALLWKEKEKKCKITLFLLFSLSSFTSVLLFFFFLTFSYEPLHLPHKATIVLMVTFCDRGLSIDPMFHHDVNIYGSMRVKSEILRQMQ